MTQPPSHASHPDTPGPRLTTPLDWSDLILDAATRQDVDDIVQWVRRRDGLLKDWNLQGRVGRGYASLFCGRGGTGKTLAAALIGKATGCEVYRVDPARLQLPDGGMSAADIDGLLDRAEAHHWILFFDEADALFGARTGDRDANDRAANQQTAYLLQRLEDHPAIVIVAANIRTQMDEAFARRFQSIVLFRMPDAERRLAIWRGTIGRNPVAPDVDLPALAQACELSGGDIVDVVRHACLRAVARQPATVALADIQSGIAAWRRRAAWTQAPAPLDPAAPQP